MVEASEGRIPPRSSPRTPTSRPERLARLASTRFDLVVVGGGITGAAVAVEATARGMSVALLERSDFGVGASGHTSKMLHGGLRYLAQGKVGLVREALRERSRLLSELDTAWVHPIPFLLPLRGSTWSRLRDRFGTWLYERLAMGRRLGPRTILDRAQVLELVPPLDSDGLRGGILYWEAVVDDVALTLFRIESAVSAGAIAVNHVEAVGAEPEPGGGFRLRARDTLSDQSISIRSRWVVDATGAWMGRTRLLSRNAPRLMPSKGIHLVFRREKIVTSVAVVLPGPDDRPTFVLPAGSLLIVGTTDTAFDGDPGTARAELTDVNYLFRMLRASFPSTSFRPSDVVDIYAGVRPLLAASTSTTSELSREDVEAYDPTGAIAVAGGKLTTHRAMATRALKLLPFRAASAPSSAQAPTRAPVQTLPTGPLPLSTGTELMARLARTALQEDWEELRRTVVRELSLGQAESLEDLIDRRLHALNRREPGFEAVVEAVAGIMAEIRGKSPEEREAMVRVYREASGRDTSILEAYSNV